MDAVQIGDNIISTIGEAALETAEAALIAEAPWLGLPVIRQVFQFLAGLLAARVIKELQNGSTGLIISFQENQNNADAKAAAAVLADAKTVEEKQKARDDFKNAYKKLIAVRATTPRP